eukprot:TRINITY_DN67507_c7_g2_i1.p1 TRINITY_DN67507_c7_g2~~TRINITY_DN67507_c7_g2_i1.p1  ORF type:complete len:910 (+),score=102.07 TRINITY_DN67507_c7_g2_i1:278-2731(+)
MEAFMEMMEHLWVMPWTTRPAEERRGRRVKRNKQTGGAEKAVVSKDAETFSRCAFQACVEFQRKCSKESPAQLVMYGGMVLASLLGKEKIEGFVSTDVDFGVVCADVESAFATQKQWLTLLVEKLTAAGIDCDKDVLLTVTPWVLTVVYKERAARRIQCCFHCRRSIHETLMYADVDCTRFAFDGTTVYGTADALRSIWTGYNVLHHRMRDVQVMSHRITKYISRGFGFRYEKYGPLSESLHRLNSGGDMTTSKNMKLKEKVNWRELRDESQYTNTQQADTQTSATKKKTTTDVGLGLDDDDDEQSEDDGSHSNYEWIGRVGREREKPAQLNELEWDVLNKLASVQAGNFVYNTQQEITFNEKQKAKKEKAKKEGDEEEEEEESDDDYGGYRRRGRRRYGDDSDDEEIRVPPVQYGNFVQRIVEYLSFHFCNHFCLVPSMSFMASKYKIVQCYDTKRWYLFNTFTEVRNFTMCMASHKREQQYGKKYLLKRALLPVPLVQPHSKVAIVTGGRTRTGTEIVLALLRQGYTVVGTSRFPYSTVKALKAMASKFTQKEKPTLLDRVNNNLYVYPIDFRSTQRTLEFIEWINNKFDNISVLINNASVVSRRPCSVYSRQVETERDQLGTKDYPTQIVLNQTQVGDLLKEIMDPTIHMDHVRTSFYPQGDRESYTTSWSRPIPKMGSGEISENNQVNSVAPVCITKALFDKLRKNVLAEKVPAYVLNVCPQEWFDGVPDAVQSGMLGSRAGLKELTRSSSGFFASYGVLMNCVDVGWVANHGPAFLPAPLSADFAASRVLHPIVTKTNLYGKVFKDFKPQDI